MTAPENLTIEIITAATHKPPPSGSAGIINNDPKSNNPAINTNNAIAYRNAPPTLSTFGCRTNRPNAARKNTNNGTICAQIKCVTTNPRKPITPANTNETNETLTSQCPIILRGQLLPAIPVKTAVSTTGSLSISVGMPKNKTINFF